MSQVVEGLVGSLERKCFHRGYHRQAGDEREEILTILAGEIGHGTERPFLQRIS